MSLLFQESGTERLSAQETASHLLASYEALARRVQHFTSNPAPSTVTAAQIRAELSESTQRASLLLEAFLTKLELEENAELLEELCPQSIEEATSLYRRLGDQAGAKIVESSFHGAAAAVAEMWSEMGMGGATLRAVMRHPHQEIRMCALQAADRLHQSEEGRALLRDEILPRMYREDRAKSIRAWALRTAIRLAPELVPELLSDEPLLMKDLSCPDRKGYASELVALALQHAPHITEAMARVVLEQYTGRGNHRYRRLAVLRALARRSDVSVEIAQIALSSIGRM